LDGLHCFPAGVAFMDGDWIHECDRVELHYALTNQQPEFIPAQQQSLLDHLYEDGAGNRKCQ
jgi:hypothetical protein